MGLYRATRLAKQKEIKEALDDCLSTLEALKSLREKGAAVYNDTTAIFINESINRAEEALK